MAEKWTYGDMVQAMSEYFEGNLNRDDRMHRDVGEMEILFDLEIMEEFVRGAFEGEDLGMCVDRALSYMPEAMKDARSACDDNRD